MKRFAFALAALIVLAAQRASAADLLPGAACSVANQVVTTGGAEDGGTRDFLICNGSTWQSTVRFASSGYVGIGTTSPNSMLEVYGNVATYSAPTYHGDLIISGNSGGLQSENQNGGLEFYAASNASGYGWRVMNPDLGSNNVPLIFQYRTGGGPTWSDLVTMRSDTGYVGIGQPSPATKLDVNGAITGTTSSTTNGIYAIEGTETGTSGQTLGVVGYNASTTNNAVGVYGHEVGTSGATFGVLGDNASATGYGGFFTNSNGGYALATGSGYVGIGNTSPGALLDIGKATTTLGTMRLEGNTSGYVQIQPAAAAGSWTMTLPSSAGTNNYFLKTDGFGVTSWAAASGSATPAGSDKQVQWNDNGAFAASSGLTFDSTKLALALGSISGANAPTTANYSELNGNTSATLSAGATWYGAASGMVVMVSGTDTSAITRTIVSRAATVQKLYYIASAANSAGKTNTITVTKNGVGTALTCSVTAATTCSDTTHSFTVNAGDEIGIQIVTGSATNTAVRHSWSIELSY